MNSSGGCNVEWDLWVTVEGDCTGVAGSIRAEAEQISEAHQSCIGRGSMFIHTERGERGRWGGQREEGRG